MTNDGFHGWTFRLGGWRLARGRRAPTPTKLAQRPAEVVMEMSWRRKIVVTERTARGTPLGFADEGQRVVAADRAAFIGREADAFPQELHHAGDGRGGADEAVARGVPQ